MPSSPDSFAATRPRRMYPACAMELYARRRFRFDWVTAAKFPIVIVTKAIAPSSGIHASAALP